MNIDTGCGEYIAAQGQAAPKPQAAPAAPADDPRQLLREAVYKGLRGEIPGLTRRLLEQEEELGLINGLLIPALDEVGRRYEAEEIFLPQLISSAAAAGLAFDVIKESIARKGSARLNKGTILLATVHGDIHDIGKNIVKVILENYGYRIVDLGRDVPAAEIVAAAQKQDIRLIGLSALMTTTVASMRQTIEALRASGHAAQVFVGGAVLTAEYAAGIGADFYARDAAQAVAIARQVLG